MARDRLNKLFLAVKYRSNLEYRERVKKNIKKRFSRHSKEISRYMAIKAMYGKSGLKCLICGEDRAIEFCHIFPLREGGTSDIHNLMILCPTHHYLFDQKKLTDEEYSKIKHKIEEAFGYYECLRLAKEKISRSMALVPLDLTPKNIMSEFAI